MVRRGWGLGVGWGRTPLSVCVCGGGGCRRQRPVSPERQKRRGGGASPQGKGRRACPPPPRRRTGRGGGGVCFWLRGARRVLPPFPSARVPGHLSVVCSGRPRLHGFWPGSASRITAQPSQREGGRGGALRPLPPLGYCGRPPGGEGDAVNGGGQG